MSSFLISLFVLWSSCTIVKNSNKVHEYRPHLFYSHAGIISNMGKKSKSKKSKKQTNTNGEPVRERLAAAVSTAATTARATSSTRTIVQTICRLMKVRNFEKILPIESKSTRSIQVGVWTLLFSTNISSQSLAGSMV